MVSVQPYSTSHGRKKHITANVWSATDQNLNPGSATDQWWHCLQALNFSVSQLLRFCKTTRITLNRQCFMMTKGEFVYKTTGTQSIIVAIIVAAALVINSGGRRSGNSSIISPLMAERVAVCRERIRRLSPQLLSVLSHSYFHPSPL